MRSARRRRRTPTDLLVLLLLPLAACGGDRVADASIRPLPDGDRSSPTADDRAVASSTSASTPLAPDQSAAESSAAANTEPAPAAGTPAGDPAVGQVQAVLDAYDHALTALAADPLGSTGLGHPALAAWHSVVQPSGSFSVIMLGELRERAVVESIVVRPGPDGFAYRHHVLGAEVLPAPAVPGTTLSFTWCGHSPGIALDAASGAVVDDSVAVSNGTGELVAGDARWQLVTLDTVDLTIEPPGTPDPCPAAVADAQRAG